MSQQSQHRRELSAEIVSKDRQAHLIGSVAYAVAGTIAIRLGSSHSVPGWLRPGAHVDISAPDASGVGQAKGRVWAIDGRVVWLVISKGGRFHGRRNVRRACAVPVAWRWAAEDGTRGEWAMACATDLSVGGMALSTEGAALSQSVLELRFSLPNEAPARAGSVDSPTADATAVPRPIKAFAYVAHVTSLPQNVLLVGLAFARIAAEDRIRVAAFVSGPGPA